MKRILNILDKTLNYLIAAALTSMLLMVFINVVLRYAFDTGLTWSEEMSRFVFVWLVFLGAIAALKDKMHLGVDILVANVPPIIQKTLYVISNAAVLFTIYLMIDGGWKMTILNLEVLAPATGLPMMYVFGILVFTGIVMGLIIIAQVIQVLRLPNDKSIYSNDHQQGGL